MVEVDLELSNRDSRGQSYIPRDPVGLVAGTDFVLCNPAGDIEPGTTNGYFVADIRLLNCLELKIDGERAHPLASRIGHRSLVVTTAIGDPNAPRLLVRRQLRLENDLLVIVEIENLRGRPDTAVIELRLGSDFADLFDVKRGVRPEAGTVCFGADDDRHVMQYASGSFERSVSTHCDHIARTRRDGFLATVQLGEWEHVSLTFTVLGDRGTGQDDHRLRAVDPTHWRKTAPILEGEPEIERVWDRSCADVVSLLLADPLEPTRPVIAAGSPWFMALFGRDSLITGLEALPLGTDILLGSLSALASRQGVTVDKNTGEQPGRILHEVRSGEAIHRKDGWGEVYYGSIDATPLFVMALAEAWRWGAPVHEVEALLPAAERAVAWIDSYGDADGDGLVEYPGSEGQGLINQAWKDSDDSMRHRDGRVAVGPIAPVEVQGYCHAAFHALADLREGLQAGDPLALRDRAAGLADAIDDAYWMPAEDCYALALDRGKNQVGSVTTNAGHLLWTGTITQVRAQSLVPRLMWRDVFTGFGLRTLSASNPGFNPLSYHCGSVWPHDTALVIAGMYRYGCTDEGGRVAAGLFHAAQGFDGRLPELFGGFPIEQHPHPVPYPTSCSPQAWAAAAPLLMVRSMFGLDLDLPRGKIRLAPHLPLGRGLSLKGVPTPYGPISVDGTGPEPGVSAPPELSIGVEGT